MCSTVRFWALPLTGETEKRAIPNAPALTKNAVRRFISLSLSWSRPSTTRRAGSWPLFTATRPSGARLLEQPSTFHEFPGTALRGAEESIFSTFISERRVRPRNLCGLADCVVRTAVSQQELGIGVNSKLCLLAERETMPSLSLCSTEGGTDHELRRIF